MQKTVCKPLTRRTLSFVDKLYGEKLFAYIYAHMCQSSGEEEKKAGDYQMNPSFLKNSF